MKNISFTNQEIGSLVSAELRKREWSVRHCCEEFNRLRHAEIASGEIQSLDKDFVQRVKSCNFKILSGRIVDFCLFLDIDLCLEKELQAEPHLKDEFILLENAVRANPAIKRDLKAILANLSVVIKRGSLNEVY